jgi:hypothetical protein
MLTAPTVLGVFGALLCASALRVTLQRKLAEQHKSKETGDHVRLIAATPGLERRKLGDMLIDADMAIGKLDPPTCSTRVLRPRLRTKCPPR